MAPQTFKTALLSPSTESNRGAFYSYQVYSAIPWNVQSLSTASTKMFRLYFVGRRIILKRVSGSAGTKQYLMSVSLVLRVRPHDSVPGVDAFWFPTKYARLCCYRGVPETWFLARRNLVVTSHRRVSSSRSPLNCFGRSRSSPMEPSQQENLAEELKDSGLIFRPGALNLLVQEAHGDVGVARQIASNLKASE